MSLNAPLGMSGGQPSPRGLSSNNPFRNRALSPHVNTSGVNYPHSPSYINSSSTGGYFASPSGNGLSPVNTFALQGNNNLSPSTAPVSPNSPVLGGGPVGVSAAQQQQQQQPPQPQQFPPPRPRFNLPLGRNLGVGGTHPLPSPRPLSTNPFLSDRESVAFNAFLEQQRQQRQLQQQQLQLQQQQQQQQPIPAGVQQGQPVPPIQPVQPMQQRQQPPPRLTEAFNSLTLNDNTQPPRAPQTQQQQMQPQQPLKAQPRLLHQRTLGDLKSPAPPASSKVGDREDLLIDIFADPDPVPAGKTSISNNRQPPFAPKFGGPGPRPRRNSDTSVMERERPAQRFERMNLEEERRRRNHDRDRRHREMSHREKDREHGHHYRERKDGSHHERERSERHRRHEGERSRRDKTDDPKKSKSSKPNRKLDTIDKLDLTGIYGFGQFHHDGPFDACNPHRNRKGIRAAPMQAFAEDSPSMVPTGGAPRTFDHDLYLGKGEDPYNDFSRTAIKQMLNTTNSQPKPDVATYDPKGKIEPVHGEETMGLGTSTFLDGAPASRAAIQENQKDDVFLGLPGANENGSGSGGGGLQRKKSLAQRIKFGGHGRERAMTDRAPRVASPERMDDGVPRYKDQPRKGSYQGQPHGHHPAHHAASASYDSYNRPSADRERKPLPRTKTDGSCATDGDEVDDFGRPAVNRVRRGSEGWSAGHGNRSGTGSASGSGSTGGGLLGRMKSLRKR